MDSPRRLVAAAVAVTALSAGCAGGERRPPAGEGDAVRASACARLLRELRLYCKEGLRDRRAEVHMDCISRRLELEEQCR